MPPSALSGLADLAQFLATDEIIGLLVVAGGLCAALCPQTNGIFEMERASRASRIASLGLTCALLWSAGTAAAIAQTVAPPEASAILNAVDFNFVGQANLGAPFQIDSGRLAETKGTSAAIRN
jgi:hypothetical protein